MLRPCQGGKRYWFIQHLAGHSRGMGFTLTVRGRHLVNFEQENRYRLIKIDKRSHCVTKSL